LGNGPAPESVKDEAGNYQKAAAYFLRHPEIGRVYLIFQSDGNKQPLIVGESYSVRVCDSQQLKVEECQQAGNVSLSADYYKGDRAMRESGYDVSFRFGPFGSATHHFAPVCLNSLLYKTETDLEHIARMLGYDKDTDLWRERAERRRSNIQKYLWNPGRGLYFDFDFTKGRESDYAYVTTFLPLWAGVATKEQSKAVVGNLKLFERRGGLVMSPYETGAQWDFPYAWAPNQLFATEGMRRYGFNDEADRISREFISMVADDFGRTGTMFEKYDGVARSSNVNVKAGYTTNVVGFGWTNGVFLELLAELSPKLSTDFKPGSPPN
jgi:alpha,alpha-trehalase